MFTLKKRHKSTDPIAMKEMAHRSSHSQSAKNSGRSSSNSGSSSHNPTDATAANNNSRSKSADPKLLAKSVNKNVEKLPPRPEMVIKNVKRPSKQSQASSSKSKN